MRAVKITISVFFLLVVVFLLGLGALYAFLDPNKLKPVIIAEMKKQTGYDMAIDGKITWTLYPWLAIYVPHMKLTEVGQKTPFADMMNVRLATDIISLIRNTQKMSGKIRIGMLTLMNVRMDSVQARLDWQNRVLTIKPITADLYNGKLSGRIAGENLISIPQWRWKVTLDGVQMKQLMADLDPANRLLVDGVGKVNMQATTRGRTRREMITTLNGNVNFSVTNGVVNAVDINYLIVAADAVLNKQPVPIPENIKRTEFESLTGSASIKDGVADITNILLSASAFKTTAHGSVDILNNLIDLKVTTVPRQVKTVVDVPIVVTGQLNHPEVRLDTNQIGKYTIKEQIEKVKDKARNLLEKHVQGEAGAYLQKLLSS